MGRRIVGLLNSPHLAAQALMPWLLNGTLTPAEQRELEEHLQSCAQCRDELARQRELMALYASSPAQVAEESSDAAFARLLERLPTDTAREAAPQRSARSAAWWRMAVAAQMGVIIALGWSVWLLQPTAPPDEAPAAYRGLAAPASTPQGGDAIVVFAPNASEADLRGALQRAGARIVDGPTAAGAYVLRFEGRRIEQAMPVLRADNAVMRVETLSADSR